MYVMIKENIAQFYAMGQWKLFWAIANSCVPLEQAHPLAHRAISLKG